MPDLAVPSMRVLLWLRNDLRTRDHEALAEAARRTDRVVPLYCLDPRHLGPSRYGPDRMGPHRARFLIESLHDLRRAFREMDADLVVRRGRPEHVIPALVRHHGLDAVHAHAEVGTEERAVERAVHEALGRQTPLRLFHGHALYHPDDLPFARDAAPDVFTPFRKAVERSAAVRATRPPPTRLAALPADLDPGAVPTLDDLGLDVPPPEPRAVLDFRGGELAGLDRLDDYLWRGDHLRRYKETRNGLLGADYSSKLSPWLAHGCLSPRTVYEQVRAYERERVRNQSTYWLLFELLWRDFFRAVGRKHGARLFHPAGPRGMEVDWERDPDAFRRWATGTTGIPFVDANMRELERTGFMSNRGRQNVASFFAKNLMLDWRLGAAHFEACLIDYDVTSNWGNWAYVAGVGNDPRDRYFNLAKQAERYDPGGAYVRHWLPELDALPDDLAHAPHTMTAMEQQLYGLSLGHDYPEPMLDLEASYRRLRES